MFHVVSLSCGHVELKALTAHVHSQEIGLFFNILRLVLQPFLCWIRLVLTADCHGSVIQIACFSTKLV